MAPDCVTEDLIAIAELHSGRLIHPLFPHNGLLIVAGLRTLELCALPSLLVGSLLRTVHAVCVAAFIRSAAGWLAPLL
jgi:hypothetical protein